MKKIPQLSTVSRGVSSVFAASFDNLNIELSMTKQVIVALNDGDENKLGRMVSILGEATVEKIVNEYLEAMDNE